MRQVSDTVKELDTRQAALDERLHEELIKVPNVPMRACITAKAKRTTGRSRRWGTPRTFDFEPKDHLRLGADLDIIDFPRGAKVAGTGFPVYKGAGALLERALLNFMLDTHTVKNGYREIFPPFLVNEGERFRHRAAAEKPGTNVLYQRGRALLRADRRGAGDEPSPR